MKKIDLTQTKDVITAYKNENFNSIRCKYTDAGTKYCFDVLDQKIMTGYLMKLACFRHLQDLKRSELNSKEFPYFYDIKKCHKILTFAGICPNPENENELVSLMPWQKFILCELFGWRDANDLKRYTKAIVSVARHQGKTFFSSIIICYSFFIENLGLSNQDILITAPTYQQAHKLFEYVSLMMEKIVEKQPFKRLAETTDLSIKKDKEIVANNTKNAIRLVSYESAKYDSRHFRTAVFDESGDPNIVDTEKIARITSGQTQVPNHSFIKISTAYEDPTVPFHKDEQLYEETMEKDYDRAGDRELCLIWSQDSLEETFKPETWIKSNPLLGIDKNNERLNGLIDERDSKALEGDLYKFQNKNMNMWLKTSINTYLKLADIEKTKISHFDMHKRTVYVGFDYSMFSDNTALAFIVPYDDNGKNKWHLMQHSFIPWYKAGSIEAKEKQDGINYRDLSQKGFCTITSHPQGMINDDQVYQWLLNFVEDNNLNIIFFGYDAYGANTMIKNLENNTTWPLNSIRQRTSELKDPTKFLQRCFAEGTVTHLDDEIMEKALVNAQIYEDKIGIQVDKAKATLKIDVVDALIDAMYQAMYHFEDFSIVNDKSREIERMSEQDVLDWFNSQESGLLDD